MPVEVRLEFGGKNITESTIHPGAKQVPTFFDPLNELVIIPTCAQDDSQGSIVIASASIEPRLVDGQMRDQVVAHKCQEKINIREGEPHVSFIDVRYYIKDHPLPSAMTIGQLVIEHLPAESVSQ